MYGHWTLYVFTTSILLQLLYTVAVGIQNRNVKFYWHFVLRMMTSCNCQGVYVTILYLNAVRPSSLRWFLAQIRFLAPKSSDRPAIFFSQCKSTFTLWQKNIQLLSTYVSRYFVLCMYFNIFVYFLVFFLFFCQIHPNLIH